MNQIETIEKMGKYTKFKALDNDTNNIVRCEKENNFIFVFTRNSRKYGHRYDLETFNKYYTLKDNKEKDQTTKWHNRLKRAIKCMEQSGLWGNIKEVFKNLLNITYEEKKEIYNNSQTYDMEITKEEEKQILSDLVTQLEECDYTSEEFSKLLNTERTKLQKEKHQKYIEQIKQKYPFMIIKDSIGEDYIDTNYIWEISECTLKSMYFGKWNNTKEKEIIKQKINNKENYNTWARTNYDTSFQYDAEKQKAWYSEEYKDCGNGHYYLALDNNTALFCEND